MTSTMSPSTEEVRDLALAVSMAQMQECVGVSFFALYTYYVLTTIDEEVSVILPQRWNIGKILFLTIRYGNLISISLQPPGGYRTYYTISPKGCKTLLITSDAIAYIAAVASDISLGLCLGALLQVGRVTLALLNVLCACPSVINFVLTLVSNLQYPTEEVEEIEKEMGYPCHAPSNEAWMNSTIQGMGRDIQRYVYFSTTTVLFLLAIRATIVRYKGRRGQLLQVLQRDGGWYYMALATVRLGQAIAETPSVVPVDQADRNPAVILLAVSTFTILPILAQRLLLNLRHVNYAGSRPVASKLLFAPSSPNLTAGFDVAVLHDESSTFLVGQSQHK